MVNKYKKIGMSLSVLMVVIWFALGTSTSLAWFVDTDEEVKNVFNFAEFDLEVSHRLENGDWEKVEQGTNVFDDEALYEPGYVQTVFLKIENKGTVPFDFKTAVTVTDFTEATNVFGGTFHLQDYLKFGLVTADSIEKLYELVATRDLAKEVATEQLNRYYGANYETDSDELAAGGTVYMALIVRMPEEVGNIANYHRDTEKLPRVELGLTVTATHKKN